MVYMNKRFLVYIIIVLLGISSLAGCSTARRAAKAISIEPHLPYLTADSSGIMSMDIVFRIPRNCLPARSRLFITPQLIVDDSLHKEFVPRVIDGPIYEKKLKRRTVLDGYQDPFVKQLHDVDDSLSLFSLPYRAQFVIPADSGSGFIRAVVSRDGCGKCSAIDTLYIAGISNPVNLIDLKESLKLNWIEPEFVIRPKIREGKGEARIQFVINQYDINLSLGNNRQEMMRMIQTLEPILTDTLATICSLNIYGMASADGPYEFNKTLARNRVSSAKQWLVERLQISPEICGLIRTDSRPEGWWPVYKAMVADGLSDSLLVKRILTTYSEGNDDVQEYYIRRLSCWPDIRRRYLPNDRKVEYRYSYAVNSFTTDEELLAMYSVRPDAFNEDELLRVAALTSDETAKMEVYGTLMHYFPQSHIASNNLAILYLRKGDIESARHTLQTQREYSAEMHATLAASYVYENDFEHAAMLLQEVDLPEARYNLGLIKARQCKFVEAYALLKEYRDVNAAIVALCLARHEEARAIMEEVEDQSPLAEYVRALIAARLNDESSLRRHLDNACKDERFLERAAHEADFEKFRHVLHVGQHNHAAL